MTTTRGRGRPSTGVRLDIRIPAEDLKIIDAIAERSGIPRAMVVRHLIAERLNSWPYNEDEWIPIHLHR